METSSWWRIALWCSGPSPMGMAPLGCTGSAAAAVPKSSTGSVKLTTSAELSLQW